MHQKNFFLKDKNTPANLPQSANTVVKLTGLPDLLHTFKNNLSASSGYERAKTCCVCTHNRKLRYRRYLITVRFKKKKKKKYTNFVITTSFQLMPEVTFKNNRKPVKCNYMVK